jgi:Domain of unknown function (DUF3943)
MKKITYRSGLKFTAFVLSCFLNVKSSAQDKGLDVFYLCQQPSTSNIDFQKINLITKAGIFPAYNANLKAPAINLPDTFLSKRSYTPLLRNENAGIWKKIKRAELFIGGAELLGATVLIVTPNEVTKWSPDWEQDAWRHMKRSLSKLPVWDNDNWKINFIGHPVSGSFYYNSLRSQNTSIFHSFLFATTQSLIWEYIIEATSENPSTQDLFITPIVGSILGESIHRLTMSMRRNGFNFFEKIFVLIFNPPFVFNNGFGSRFNPVRQNHLF